MPLSKSPPSPPPPPPPLLRPPSPAKAPKKLLRRFRSAFKLFPTCTIPVSLIVGGGILDGGGSRVTGTLFGHRKSRANLAFQEKPRCVPFLVLELSIQAGKLLNDMGLGLVRIALECEKDAAGKKKLVDEPIWTLFCNGRKTGYAVKREPTDDDLKAMQTLQAVSMGAGVLPAVGDTESPDDDLAYMRAFFQRVVGSKDSETYHMINPDSNSGVELSIFFVRI